MRARIKRVAEFARRLYGAIVQFADGVDIRKPFEFFARKILFVRVFAGEKTGEFALGMEKPSHFIEAALVLIAVFAVEKPIVQTKGFYALSHFSLF